MLRSAPTLLCLKANCGFLKNGIVSPCGLGEHVYELKERGSLRRCAGQGDILSGKKTVIYCGQCPSFKRLSACLSVFVCVCEGCLVTAFYWSDKMFIKGENAVKPMPSMNLADCDGVECSSLGKMPTTFSWTGIECTVITVSDYLIETKVENPSLLLDPSSAAQRMRGGAVMSSILAATVVKKASELGFAEKGRSMTSPDVMKAIGKAFQTVTGTR